MRHRTSIDPPLGIVDIYCKNHVFAGMGLAEDGDGERVVGEARRSVHDAADGVTGRGRTPSTRVTARPRAGGQCL